MTTAIEWKVKPDRMFPYVYEADSPYHNGGSPIKWRLRQRFDNDRIEWYPDHDAELCPDPDKRWETLAEAQQECQKEHDTIIELLHGLQPG